MSRGRSDSPWPSGSNVITRFPRAARSRASGLCIFCESSSPGIRTVGARAGATDRVGQPLPVIARRTPSTSSDPLPSNSKLASSPHELHGPVRWLSAGRRASGWCRLRAADFKGQTRRTASWRKPHDRSPGRVVAITGGARGIGRATAAALIAQGSARRDRRHRRRAGRAHRAGAGIGHRSACRST